MDVPRPLCSHQPVVANNGFPRSCRKPLGLPHMSRSNPHWLSLLDHTSRPPNHKPGAFLKLLGSMETSPWSPACLRGEFAAPVQFSHRLSPAHSTAGSGSALSRISTVASSVATPPLSSQPISYLRQKIPTPAIGNAGDRGAMPAARISAPPIAPAVRTKTLARILCQVAQQPGPEVPSLKSASEEEGALRERSWYALIAGARRRQQQQQQQQQQEQQQRGLSDSPRSSPGASGLIGGPFQSNLAAGEEAGSAPRRSALPLGPSLPKDLRRLTHGEWEDWAMQVIRRKKSARLAARMQSSRRPAGWPEASRAPQSRVNGGLPAGRSAAAGRAPGGRVGLSKAGLGRTLSSSLHPRPLDVRVAQGSAAQLPEREQQQQQQQVERLGPKGDVPGSSSVRGALPHQGGMQLGRSSSAVNGEAQGLGGNGMQAVGREGGAGVAGEGEGVKWSLRWNTEDLGASDSEEEEEEWEGEQRKVPGRNPFEAAFSASSAWQPDNGHHLSSSSSSSSSSNGSSSISNGSSSIGSSSSQAREGGRGFGVRASQHYSMGGECGGGGISEQATGCGSLGGAEGAMLSAGSRQQQEAGTVGRQKGATDRGAGLRLARERALLLHLHSEGMAPAHLSRFLADPRAPLAMHVDLVAERVEFLRQQLGMESRAEVWALVARHPRMLRHPVETRLRPALSFLRSLGLSTPEMRHILRRAPSLLEYTLHSCLIPRIAFLKEELGLSEGEVATMIFRSPQVLMMNTRSGLLPRLNFLRRDLGLDRDLTARVLVRHPQLLHYSVKDGLQRRMRLFRSWGMATADVALILQRCPQIFSLSISDSLIPKHKYLIEHVGLPIQAAIAFPAYFTLSLEQRIRPRHLFFCHARQLLQQTALPLVAAGGQVKSEHLVGGRQPGKAGGAPTGMGHGVDVAPPVVITGQLADEPDRSQSNSGDGRMAVFRLGLLALKDEDFCSRCGVSSVEEYRRFTESLPPFS